MPSPGSGVRLASVSVIIPTYNEERFIGRCLDAVFAQDYPGGMVEVIVVDNGSSDNTVALVRARGAQVHQFPAIPVGALRNRGARLATHEVLAFLDADCIPPRHWLQGCAEAMSQGACLTGDSYDIPEHPHWIERAWFAQEPVGRRRTHLIPAGDMILPRESFLALGGFNETLTAGEDAEFCLRARERLPIIADDRTRVVHLGNPASVHQFLARETWHGMGALGGLRLNWRDKPLAGTLAFALASVGQALGLVMLAFGKGGSVLLWSSIVIVALVASTIGYRLRTIRDPGMIPALVALYYLYYLARSRSLVLLATGRKYRRGKK